MESYLKGLNKEQLEAARHEAGPCMVLAGPGTGKTTVITARVSNLIKKKIAAPENILVVTFSRAAANEMKERYERLSNDNSSREVSFGTFHSVFYRLLRQYRGYRLEDLLDESLKFNAIRNIVRRLGVENAEDEEQLRDIISDMEYVTSTMADPLSYKPSSCDIRQLRMIMGGYGEFKEQSGKYDYDDILKDCYYLLKDNPRILSEIREKFKYVLVDEFQDINALQFETIKLIAEPRNNIFIVGDDDQSIYGFRGAAPDILINFEKLYPESRRIYLKNNYRTTENILKSALAVINNNKNRFAKMLEAVNSKGSLPVTVEAEDFEEEARSIAARIGQMSRSGREFSDFAVIYRTNLQSRAVIDAFMDAGIPFVTLDGIMSMYNHWIFKDIMSYLKLGTGLGNNRDVMRVINRPKRYISKDTMEKAEKLGGDFIHSIANHSSLNRLQINGMLEFMNDLKRLGTMEPQNAVRFIRNVIGYDEYLKEYAAAKGIGTKGLMETIEEIESSASSFKSILLYMQHVEEVSDKLGEKNYKDLGSNNVKLLTMHKAKGLEFDTVFICGSVEGLSPYIKDDAKGDACEEERRLYYVAMTRAKRELWITVPKHRYGKAVKTSRFVEEFQKGIDYGSQVTVGQKVYHKIYYSGTIKEVNDSAEGTRIKVDFDGSIKELNLKACLKNEIIRLL
ncbi:MAG TPA: ATP-dependent helicase [Candidatus Nitrosocosmicus sp.]|nr:ATP-dependent helicase [Candidatus Nitrosocosmicus sp.]